MADEASIEPAMFLWFESIKGAPNIGAPEVKMGSEFLASGWPRVGLKVNIRAVIKCNNVKK
jgi:hypothetical protein